MLSRPRTNFGWKYPAATALLLGFATGTVEAQRPMESSPETARSVVSADLEMIYGKTETASKVSDYSMIYDFCRNIAGDTTRLKEDRQYARSLMSWAANRRGEARSDQAGAKVREQEYDQAAELDSQAKKDFELAIQLDGSRWRAHHNLAILRAVKGDNPGALDSFNQTIRINPEFGDAFFNRGEIYFRTNQFELAIADQNKAIELKPEDSTAFSARAHSLYAVGKTNEALADYSKAMELAPNSAEAATEFADTCQSLGKWKEAARAYQTALKLDGENPRALRNAAWMMATCPDNYYRNGDSALETAQRAVQFASGPSSVQTLDVLAAAQAAAGNYVAAQSTILEALKATTDPSLRNELQMRNRQYQRKRPYVQPNPVNTPSP